LFNICACSAVEEVTVIRSSLIIPRAISRPAPARVLIPDTQEESEDDFPEDEEDAREEERRIYSEYSKQLGIALDGTENKALLSAIEEWLGTRYKMGGCSKSGVDCSCFVKAVYQKAYDTELGRSSADMFQHDLISVRLDNLKEGDLLFFKTKGGGISHVGIYLKNDKFVHVSRLKGVKISSLDYFKQILFSARRLKNKDQMISKKSVENMPVLRK
jgi:lipoprotein Spr